MPPQCPPGRGIWSPRVVLTEVWLTWAHVLLSAIDHLELSRILCNRLSSFFICNPQSPLTPLHPLTPPPHPQYRHLVVKSGTTGGQHHMSSACGSDCCFVRCTPPHMPPQCPPGRGIWSPRVVLTEVWLTWAHVLLSAIYCLDLSRVLCNTLLSFFICKPQCPLTPYTPDTPSHPQYRHLVVKSGTTAG